jgi:hypothetical protein
VQDWVIGAHGVGSSDRALGLCGCLGRKLAATGFDQGKLDALTRFYAGELGETELDAIDTTVLVANDSESSACLKELPARAATAR